MISGSSPSLLRQDYKKRFTKVKRFRINAGSGSIRGAEDCGEVTAQFSWKCPQPAHSKEEHQLQTVVWYVNPPDLSGLPHSCFFCMHPL
jgi:hypothetical protein